MASLNPNICSDFCQVSSTVDPFRKVNCVRYCGYVEYEMLDERREKYKGVILNGILKIKIIKIFKEYVCLIRLCRCLIEV